MRYGDMVGQKQEKVKETLNEDEEGKVEDSTYPLPKKTG
jgi:hypothetical protein